MGRNLHIDKKNNNTHTYVYLFWTGYSDNYISYIVAVDTS